MPDTQFMRCSQYDTGTRRLSERLGEIQREEGMENENEENKNLILKHEVSIQSIKTFHKPKKVEAISPSSAAEITTIGNDEKRQTVTKACTHTH